MEAERSLITAVLQSMQRNGLRNYVIPGLSSHQLGDGARGGQVRMFSCFRDQQEHITPHSHRFDFAAYVLNGKVWNQIWTIDDEDEGGLYMVSELLYGGEVGEYKYKNLYPKSFRRETTSYSTGDWYFMRANEIHSIEFQAGTQVIFFEGPEKTNGTKILEPFVHDKVVRTFDIKEWMFEKE